MNQARKILIADPDLSAVRALSRALRTRGYQVHYAPDGSRALEVAVLRHPELVLFDARCKLLPAPTFVQILRTNPRTEDIRVIFTGLAEDAEGVRAGRDGFLRKPFNLDEVLARIEHLFRRAEAALNFKGAADEIGGTLSQLSIPDLLQVLAMNRRTGRLTLTRSGTQGDIWVSEGRPVQAHVGNVEGEKALFRLLRWTEGSFAFHPGPAPKTARITRTMEDALLEGMRQGDEVGRLLPALPGLHVQLEIAADAPLTQDQHPVTAQVMALLRQPRTVADLLDLASAVDLEVLSALSTLLQKELARPVDGQLLGVAPLLNGAEVHALRTRLSQGRRIAPTAVAKVMLCVSSTAALRNLMTQLPGFRPQSAEPGALKDSFGTLGRYDVSDALQVDFAVLPAVEAGRPLWRPFCSGAVGGLILDAGDAAVSLGAFMAKEIRLPVVLVGAKVPPVLQDAPGGASAVAEGIHPAVRALLLRVLEARGA